MEVAGGETEAEGGGEPMIVYDFVDDNKKMKANEP